MQVRRGLSCPWDMASTAICVADSKKVPLPVLSTALADKAERELGEKPSWRDRDIDALRQLVEANRGIYM